MKKRSLICIILIFANSAQAATYSVKSGDTLSEIAKRLYPNMRIYGRDGSLNKLIRLNGITNPNLILVGQEITITRVQITVKKEKKQITTQENPIAHEGLKKDETLPETKSTYTFQKDEWKIGAAYGVKYYSYKQSGDLGSATVAITLPNNYQLYSEYTYKEIGFRFDFNRYKLKYESGSNSGEEDLNEFTLKSSYKNFVAGLSMIDTPSFKNEAGVVSMSKVNTTNLILGYKFLWQLPVEKETNFEVNPSVYFPLAISSSNTDIKTSSTSGYMTSLEAKLSRTIKENDHYKIRAIWPVDLRYHSLSYDVEWGSSQGKNESSYYSVGTRLGLEVSF